MQKLCCVRTIQQSSASLDYLSQAYQPVSPSILSHFRWELYHFGNIAKQYLIQYLQESDTFQVQLSDHTNIFGCKQVDNLYVLEGNQP